jgi:two-component system cell cycle sensor histidine kinase/response regulator CckA
MTKAEAASRTSYWGLRLLIPLILLGGFVIDLHTPRGFADWAFYLLPALLAMKAVRRQTMLFIAGTGSVATVFGFLLSPPGSPLWLSAINRSLGLILLWTAVAASLRWKRADEALMENGARLRAAERIALMGNWTWRAATDVLHWSEGLYRLTGRDSRLPAPTLQETSSFFSPDSCERLKSSVDRALATGEPFELELELIRTDGQRRWVVTRGEAVHGAAGKLVGLRGTLQDITWQKQDENALRLSEERYRVLFERNLAGIVQTAPDGRILDCNDAFAHMFGYASRAELLGKQIQDLWLDAAEREEFGARLIRKRVIRNAELRLRHKDGQAVWVLENASVVRRSEGEEPIFEATLLDITDRRRAEEALVKLRQAVDASGEVVFMTDGEGTITSINPEFTRLYGYTEAEVVGKVTPRILKSGTLRPEEYADFWSTILDKRVARGEIVNKTQDGRYVTVESSTNPILDEHGDITGFLAIQRDITGRKQLEEQFRQAQKMEAVGRLAGGVAHDFNNLLTIINGYAQLLLERSESTSSAHDQAIQILNAGERAAALTRQLLAFSRKQVLAPTILDLNRVLESMHGMLRRLIGEDVELVTIPRDSLGQVKADPGQVEQVIMNLVVNARDAMPRGGRLTIETGNVDLDESYARTHVNVTPGPYVMLAVSDTGCGMDAETITHIFEPFFTTKEQGKGTGLGLSTVYGIVKQTGGHVGVYSEPGQGTTIKVYLPRLDRVIEPPAEKEEVTRLSGTETILVVEDEAGVRSLIQSVLDRHGYTVLIAGSPAEAAKLSEQRQGQIHLLLTDVVMPGFSGKELADHLAFARPDMKVLFISGYTADAIAHHGILDADTAFLQKPFTPNALLRKVRETIDK